MLLERKYCEACDGRSFWEDWNEEGKHCQICNNEGYTKLDSESIVFVNVYEVTRHYGGPEEGGWWFNWYVCVETYPTRNKNADTVKENLIKAYEDKAYGDIYSVLGGTEIHVMIESKPAESQTRERPMYE